MKKWMIAICMTSVMAANSSPSIAGTTDRFDDFQQQDKVVSGKVTDEKGNALHGATVSVKGTKVNAITKEDGTFSLKVPDGTTKLTVSYVGMLDQEIDISSRTMISVALNSMGGNMNDVVVVGYGTAKRSQTTGAVATVKAQDIQDIPAPNIAATLRGRVAGLGVSAASGRPGASIRLNVRDAYVSSAAATGGYGVTDEPLYVIDNIVVNKEQFDALDPSMVEDITVLKDANAAIYGAAGAKGVILITTKRGKSGAPKFNYNGYVGHSDATRKPEMLSAYDQALLLNDTYRMNNARPEDFFSPEDLETLRTIKNVNWFDDLWRAALTQRHNLSVSGGSDKITFFVGGSYQNENANYAAMKADKYGFRSGLQAKIGSAFKADINFNVDHNIRKSSNGLNENDQGFLEDVIQTPRWVPIQIDGKYVHNEINGNTANSPQAQIASGYYRTSKSQSYRINSSLMYQPESGPLKGFTARFQVSQSAGGTDNDEYNPSYKVYRFERTGNNKALYTNIPLADPKLHEMEVNGPSNQRLIRGLSKSNSYQGFLTLQYQRSFGRHNMNVIVGGEQSRSYGEDLEARWITQELLGLDEYFAFNQDPTVEKKGITESTKRSFFGRFSYNFDNKYTIEGITRLDASSNFAANNIWGFFPSVGLGWVVSQENFFRDYVPFVNYMKIRANFGLTGDDRIGSRLWQERYGLIQASYVFGSTNPQIVPGFRPAIFPNPDITWEKKRALNVGFDLSFFNNKLSLSADFFQNYVYDAFDKGDNENYPFYAGFQAPLVNHIIRYNWGSEFSIGYQTRFNKDLAFKANMNFSFGNSVIQQQFFNRYELWINTPDDWIVEIGTDPRKYNSGNYGLLAEGMFKTQAEVDAFLAKRPNYTINNEVPQPGWLYYKDLNGDGVITDLDKTTMFDRTTPALSTGIQLGLTYKSLALSVNIAANFGGKDFYDSKARRSAATINSNVPAFWNDRWTPENPNGRFPRVDDASMKAGWESTFWAVDGTMIRVNDLTLSYTVPSNLTQKVGLSNVRLIATGNNLWVIKNPLPYKDPYSAYIYDYPTLRTMSLGLSLGL